MRDEVFNLLPHLPGPKNVDIPILGVLCILDVLWLSTGPWKTGGVEVGGQDELGVRLCASHL